MTNATLDASFVVGICAKAPDKYLKAQAELSRRISEGCPLHAPHLLIMEATYVLCGKQKNNELTEAEHGVAVSNLQMLASSLIFPADSDASLLLRAEQIRRGYGCSRSADCFYLALAE